MKKELVEAELFGHAKKEFTGADSPRTGLTKQVHQGSLFLDELFNPIRQTRFNPH